jgi:hypothetical protein
MLSFRGVVFDDETLMPVRGSTCGLAGCDRSRRRRCGSDADLSVRYDVHIREFYNAGLTAAPWARD